MLWVFAFGCCGCFAFKKNCLSHTAHPCHKGVLLSCDDTITISSPLSPANSENNALPNKISKILDTKFEKFEKDLHVFQSNIELLNSTLDPLKSKIVNLDIKIKNIKDNLDNEIIDEISERGKRSRNLILFNVSEADSTLDLISVNEILIIIQAKSCVTGISVCRLARIQPSGKPRPICMTFPSAVLPLFIIKNRFKCVGSIKIAQDLILKQRAFLTKLRTRLHETNDPNETIRYINGIPKIIIRNIKNVNSTH